MFGVTYGLSAPLIALDLAQRGFDETLIGLNAAMHAVGVLLVASVLPRLAARFGQRPVIVTALLASAGLMASFPLVAGRGRPLHWARHRPVAVAPAIGRGRSVGRRSLPFPARSRDLCSTGWTATCCAR